MDDDDYDADREGQEYGVTGMDGDNDNFRPATREYYDSQQWSVVAAGEPTAESSVSAPETLEFTPSRPRLRNSDELPMLIPSRDALYIAPLLVILHGIPLGRKALLNFGEDLAEDYGYDPMWWNGGYIDLADELGLDDATSSLKRLMVETQRIAAFLDGGSRRPLSDLSNLAVLGVPKPSVLSMRGQQLSDKPVGRFLQDLTYFWGQDTDRARVFQTTAVDLSDGDENGGEQQKFTNFIAEVSIALASSIYDLLDEVLWYNLTKFDQCLAEIADIVTITFKRDDGTSGTGIEVPTVFYPDRYTKQVSRFVKKIAQRRKDAQKQMAQLNQRKFQVSTSMGKDNSKLLRTTLEYLNAVIDGDNEDEEEDPDALREAKEDIEQVQKVFEQKKADIADEMVKLQEYVKKLDEYFKTAESPGAEELLDEDDTELPAPLRPYRLFGLIISPTEFCFRRQATSASDTLLIDVDGDSSEIDSKPQDEWYRVCYTSTFNPIVSKTTEEDAIKQAQLGSAEFRWQEVVAVYANDYALDSEVHKQPLTDALGKFIRQDKSTLYNEVVRFHQGQESTEVSTSRQETPLESASITTATTTENYDADEDSNR